GAAGCAGAAASGRAGGVRASGRIAAGPAATASRSAPGWKGATTFRTSPHSTSLSPDSSGRCDPRIRRSPMRRSSGIRISRPAGRRIRGRLSTGRFAGACAHAERFSMKLIALILGLALEHVATRRLKLRELRFFDPLFDFALARARPLPPNAAALVLAVFLALATLPVILISRALEQTFVPWDLPYLAFAVLIVFMCVGPRDLDS